MTGSWLIMAYGLSRNITGQYNQSYIPGSSERLFFSRGGVSFTWPFQGLFVTSIWVIISGHLEEAGRHPVIPPEVWCLDDIFFGVQSYRTSGGVWMSRAHTRQFYLDKWGSAFKTKTRVIVFLGGNLIWEIFSASVLGFFPRFSGCSCCCCCCCSCCCAGCSNERFLPALLASFLASFLPSFLSCPPCFLPSFLPCLLPSFLSFLASFLFSFLPALLASFLSVRGSGSKRPHQSTYERLWHKVFISISEMHWRILPLGPQPCPQPCGGSCALLNSAHACCYLASLGAKADARISGAMYSGVPIKVVHFFLPEIASKIMKSGENMRAEWSSGWEMVQSSGVWGSNNLSSWLRSYLSHI